MGGGSTKIKQETQPPQISPYALPGYIAGQEYATGQIKQPSVYTGQRVAPFDPLQTQAQSQYGQIFGQPSATEQAAGQTLATTAAGGYMGGPQQQQAIESMTAPLFQTFRTQVIPQIRDVSQATGQGVTSARRGIAEQEAAQKLTRDVGTTIAGQAYVPERQLQQQAALAGPAAQTTAEQARLGALFGGGAQGQAQQQAELSAQQQQFQEGVQQQNQTLAQLLGNVLVGPAGGSTTQTQNLSAFQQIQQAVGMLSQLASTAAMIYGMSSRDVKQDIVEPNSSIVDDLLAVKVHQWRYKWDPAGVHRIGPIIDELPASLKYNDSLIDYHTMIGALIKTVQAQDERIKTLESAIRATHVA